MKTNVDKLKIMPDVLEDLRLYFGAMPNGKSQDTRINEATVGELVERYTSYKKRELEEAVYETAYDMHRILTTNK